MGAEAVTVSRPRGGDTRYLLGHSQNELERLDIQGELYRDITTRAFREAGIEEGMSVLDIGCGTGDVSLTAAEVVGRSGSVLGIDRGAEAIAVAHGHSISRGLEHVSFDVSEIDDFEDSRDFDALVGRFVLMHQRDAVATLTAALRALRPGGIVVMIESYMEILMSGVHSEPHSPLYDEIVRWKSAVVQGAGADLRAGARLRRTFLDAGLSDPTTRLEARLEGGPDSPYYHYVAESVRSMLPEAARLGLPGFGADDVDGLEERLRGEVVAGGGVLVVWPVVCAWARKRHPPS